MKTIPSFKKLFSIFFLLNAFLYIRAQPPADLPWEADTTCGGIMIPGIAAVTCGTLTQLPVPMRYTLGLTNLNGALPNIGRLDVTSQQASLK